MSISLYLQNESTSLTTSEETDTQDKTDILKFLAD